MIQKLNLRYPFYYLPEVLLRQTVLVLVLVFAFLWLLRPVGVDSGITIEFTLLCLIYSVIASVSFFILYGLLPNIFPSFFTQARWTIGKEVIGFLTLMICVALFNFVLRQFVSSGSNQLTVAILLEELAHALIVGIIPLTLISAFNFIGFVRKHSDLFPLLYDANSRTVSEAPEEVIIKSTTSNESITICPNDLYYAKAAGNYVELIMDYDGQPVKRMLRITLSEIEDVFCDLDFFVRTHRTYLVNVNRVNSFDGNAQGFRLHLNECSEKIPVSRSRIGDFKKSMARLQHCN